MMQSNGGLLDLLTGGSAPSTGASTGGGLLNGLLGQGGQGSQGGQSGGLQMAQQLSLNPTPETARQIIAQLHQMRNPEAVQFEQMLGSVMNNPQALKQLADAVVQKLGGGNA
jgi:hypothetical protein